MLKLQGLTKAYGSRLVVDHVSLEIAIGEFLAVLGPSGCGKTTLLRLISGLASPGQGRIFWNDREITESPPEERGFGLVFQRHALMPHLTVEENIAFPLVARNYAGESSLMGKTRYFFGRLMRLLDSRQRDQVERMLQLVRLAGFNRRWVDELSGGEAQRVALARSLVSEPKLLLMDEPLSSIDRQLKIELRSLIKKIHGDLGLTIIYVTHDQEEAVALSGRTALMFDGRMIQVGPAREILKNPANDWVRGFFNVDDLATPELREIIKNLF
ncbi:MAG: ABC transporter ATP-binding protein [Elusimicrobia bacterium]|nr:ABC transporter ATP-binding protein [Elusimicrobiota bacterium]